MNSYQSLKVGYGSSDITTSDIVFQDISRITNGDICDKSLYFCFRTLKTAQERLEELSPDTHNETRNLPSSPLAHLTAISAF